MLNMTKVELERISNVDMYLFFKKGMRPGVSYISKKYSQANSKYLKSFDPKQQSKDIIYLDANNLYRYVMFEFLLKGRFKWIDPNDFGSNKCSSNGSKECVLKIDFVYRKELRELHNDIIL